MILFIISFFICFGLPFVCKKFFSKSRISVKKEKPMFLGISIYLSVFAVFACTSVYYKANSSFLMSLFAGSTFILLIGVLDDIMNLSVKVKLTGQIGAAGMVILMGVRTSIACLPVWANMLITLIWIVALINAFNFLDIMDGLCTGIGFIICVTFLALSIISGMHDISLFFCILSGSILAAFIHNMPLARFYLGDSGSMLIGFIFACSTMQINYAPDANHGLSLFVPVLIVFLPVYDLVFTVFMRWKKHISIFKKSNDHFVLVLRNRGFSVRHILIIMYMVCLLSGFGAFLLNVSALALKPLVLGSFVLGVLIAGIFVARILKPSRVI